jgi:transcriptional regulator with XRE-family HTH domain
MSKTEQLGEVLEGWRSWQGLNVREAAEVIGITHSTLSRLERGLPIDANNLIVVIHWLTGRSL